MSQAVSSCIHLPYIYPSTQASSSPFIQITPHSTMSGEASPSEFVTIRSKSDGYTFVVPRYIALASGTMKSMLDEDGAFFIASLGQATPSTASADV